MTPGSRNHGLLLSTLLVAMSAATCLGFSHVSSWQFPALRVKNLCAGQRFIAVCNNKQHSIPNSCFVSLHMSGSGGMGGSEGRTLSRVVQALNNVMPGLGQRASQTVSSVASEMVKRRVDEQELLKLVIQVKAAIFLMTEELFGTSETMHGTDAPDA
jgi:hypothetical protein